MGLGEWSPFRCNGMAWSESPPVKSNNNISFFAVNTIPIHKHISRVERKTSVSQMVVFPQT